MNVRAVGTVGVLAVAIGVAAAPASSGAAAVHHPTHHKSVIVTPADRDATHAYLIAVEQADEAQLANGAQSTAAVEALAGGISSECAGVLAGAPPREVEPLSKSIGPAPGPPLNARAEGERARQSRQRDSLKLELSFARDVVVKQTNHDALAAVVSKLSPLKWSNPRITSLVHLIVTIIQEELAIASPPACADMRAWVASGYKTLTPASKEFQHHTAVLLVRFIQVLAIALTGDVKKPFDQFLAPYESAADRTLARHNEALTAQLNKEQKAIDATLQRLETAVGLPAPKIERPIERPQRKPVVVGRGRTAAGTRFVVRARPHSRSSRSVCPVFVTIEEPSQPSGNGLFSLLEGEGTDRCLSRSHITPEQRVSCRAGLLTVEANLRPAVHSVRLLLSDHRTITSPAVRIPVRLGGPVGIYYQSVRGPSPIPVSLTELDAHGNTLTVLKLNAVVECTKHPRKDFVFLPIAHGRLPQGDETFAIFGEYYREFGHAHFDLHVGSDESFGGGPPGHFAAGVEAGSGPGNGFERIFEPQTSTGCTPQPYEIVYGLLKAPREKVFALVAGKLVPLRTVAIPARLHAHGELAYGAFSPIPTELVFTDTHGRTIATDDVSKQASAATETCEGESEG